MMLVYDPQKATIKKCQEMIRYCRRELKNPDRYQSKNYYRTIIKFNQKVITEKMLTVHSVFLLPIDIKALEVDICLENLLDEDQLDVPF